MSTATLLEGRQQGDEPAALVIEAAAPEVPTEKMVPTRDELIGLIAAHASAHGVSCNQNRASRTVRVLERAAQRRITHLTTAELHERTGVHAVLLTFMQDDTPPAAGSLHETANAVLLSDPRQTFVHTTDGNHGHRLTDCALCVLVR